MRSWKRAVGPLAMFHARSVRKQSLARASSGSASTTSHPRSSIAWRVPVSTSSCDRSTGTPMSGDHATRSGRSGGATGRGMRNGRCIGSRPSGAASTSSSRATSSTVRPIGPRVLIGIHALPGATLGTTRTVGRKPTTLFHAAGLRSEPPVSLPSAVATMRQARATAAPPLDPPAVRPSPHGFCVTPWTLLNVCEPAPNSGVFVFPTATAPAAFMRATSRQSAAGRWPANSGDP